MFSGGTVPTPVSTADLLATTLDTYSDQLVSNVVTKHRLLNAIKKSDGMIPISGGEQYDLPLEYATGTMQTFGRTTSLNTNTPNTMMTYKVTIKNAAVPCEIYQVDEWANEGSKNRRINYVEAKIKNIEKSIRKGMETQLWTAGAGALDFVGVPDLIDDAVIIESMDPATYTWFASQVRTSVGDFDTNGMDELTKGITAAREASGEETEEDEPDVIGGDADFWNAFIIKADQRSYLVNSTKADLGFRGPDGNKGPTKDGVPVTLFSNATAGEIFGLNFKYIKLVYQKSVNFALTPWEPIGGGQLGKKRFVVFRGASCVSNRQAQVKWTGVTY